MLVSVKPNADSSAGCARVQQHDRSSPRPTPNRLTLRELTPANVSHIKGEIRRRVAAQESPSVSGTLTFSVSFACKAGFLLSACLDSNQGPLPYQRSASTVFRSRTRIEQPNPYTTPCMIARHKLS